MEFELEIQKPGRFKKPTVELIRMYCEQNSYQIDPEAFYDYFESVGWMIGKKKMKDWQAAVRTWWRRSLEYRLDKLPSRPQPKLHKSKPERKLSETQKQAGRMGAELLRQKLR